MRWFLVLVPVVATFGAAVAGAGQGTPTCAAADVRVLGAHGVEPLSQTDMFVVRLRDAGRTCLLAGIPNATAIGRPDVDSVAVADAPLPFRGRTIRLRHGRTASVLFATSNECTPWPAPRYRAVSIEMGDSSVVARVPAMRVSAACPPEVLGFF